MKVFDEAPMRSSTGQSDGDALLRCERSDEEHAVVLRLAGEIDLASKADLDGWLCVAQALGRPVVVDLEEVRFMGSSGLASFLQAHLRGPLRLRGIRPGVRRCFEITGLDDELRIEDDRVPS